jgi:hypothetical protein
MLPDADVAGLHREPPAAASISWALIPGNVASGTRADSSPGGRPSAVAVATCVAPATQQVRHSWIGCFSSNSLARA